MNSPRSTPLVTLALASVALASLAVLQLGCAGMSTESAAADTMTAHVGQYDPPPSGIPRVRVGVPDFEVATGVTKEVSTLAADQLTTLGVNTRRFIMIERAQLGQLLKEQGLTGKVSPAELAKSGSIRGIDYMMLGKVTNMRVKQEQSKGGFGLGNIPIPGTRSTFGAFDYKNKSSQIKVDCGVDLRLVNATNGEIVAADFAEYSRTDSISGFGISVLGVGASSDADLKIDANNRGKLLRLALDNAIRKLLPTVDDHLVNQAAKNASSKK